MYVITGATGNTGSVAARQLLSQGKKVRAIARHADRLQDLAREGAEPFTAELTDAAALTRAFTGAEAVYALIPPNISAPAVSGYQNQVVEALAQALELSKVKHAVTLSSVGADKPSGTGPVLGLHAMEERLNRISGLNVLHLRAAYFMENTLGQIGIINNFGITAGPLRADLRLPMIATRDIGAAAAEFLLKLDFSGHQTRELLGERDLTMTEVAGLIGKAIGRPDLRYSQLPDEQLRPALLQMGMSPNMADLLLEMSAALNSGHMRALEPRSPRNTTPTSYETFVQEVFLPAYSGKSQAA